MTSPRDIILHRRSSLANKRPLVSDIGIGEIAVNYNKDDVSLYIRDSEANIRKIGGVWYSDVPPDPTLISSAEGWQELSHGEIWVQQVAAPGETDVNTGAAIYIWNKNLNGGTGDWVRSGDGYFSILGGYLDQFADGADGDDYIHTDRNQLKINNKSALRGYATTIPSDNETDSTKADTLVINDQHNFATGVTLNAMNLVIDSMAIEASSDSIVLNSKTEFSFQSDSVTGVAESVFTYTGHGLFNGEEVFVTEFLNDGTTPSGVPQGNYFIAEASLNTFKLYDGATNILATGNVKINYSPQLLLDQEYNVTQSGNFKVKGLSELPDVSQIADGRWDLYQNTSNGNVRIFSRQGTNLIQPDASVLSIPVKNSSLFTIPKGTPVYFTGNDPIRKVVLVEKADSASDATMNAIGLLQGELAPGAIGDATMIGPIQLLASDIDGVTGSSDSGKEVYVKSGGGLTITKPDFTTTISQKIGILFQDDETNCEVFVNHPDLNAGLPDLPEDYVWVGDTNDQAFARKLNSDSFKTQVLSGAPEIALADEIKFGAYEFLWDTKSTKSKVQTKVTTSDLTPTSGLFQLVDSFPTTYRSAKFFVQITMFSGVTPINFQITELLVIHDGTDASVTDYGTASIPGNRMGDFSADVAGSNVEVKFAPYEEVGGDIQVKVLRTSVLS